MKNPSYLDYINEWKKLKYYWKNRNPSRIQISKVKPAVNIVGKIKMYSSETVNQVLSFFASKQKCTNHSEAYYNLALILSLFANVHSLFV